MSTHTLSAVRTGARWLAAVLCIVLLPQIARAQATCNVATNGSFEVPNIQSNPSAVPTPSAPAYASYLTSVGTVGGWTVVGGTVDVLRWYSNASNGAQSIDMYGTAAGTIQQTFSGLTPGAQYTFSIDYSGLSTTGSIGTISLNTGAGFTNLQTLAPVANSVAGGTPPAQPSNLVTWATFSHTFTATSTSATIRIANQAAAGPGGTGLFVDNFQFAAPAPCQDFGDAPDGYGTLQASNGARHAVAGYDAAAQTTPLMLGDNVGIEINGQPGANAALDVFDDGYMAGSAVSVTSTTSAGVTIRARNATAVPATLAGWVDFDGNNVFDATERAEIVVPANTTTPTPFTLSWSGQPSIANLGGTTRFARFRLASNPADVALPVGVASDGEVEDHLLQWREPPLVACPVTDVRATQRFWFFGITAGIDFGTTGTTATAIAATGGGSDEGTTVITDTAGQLLFWSNGLTIFNRNHVAMPNGTGLSGNPSATQTVAAFPSLTRPGIYFVVSTSAASESGGDGRLFYAVVDMSLDGGLGDVVSKNTPLGAVNAASEALTAVPNADGTGFWVLTFTVNSPNILAYEFDSNGPVTGTAVASPMSTNNGNFFGTFNFSADLRQLVQMTGRSDGTGQIRLLDFDAASGRITERFTWTLASGAGRGQHAYSADFSPNGDYVYATRIFMTGRLFRYRIAGALTGAEVLATEQNLGGIGSSGGQVKRAPNGKMYVANRTVAAISVVNNPDSAATPGFVGNGFALAPGTTSRYGLPQMVTGCPVPTATDLTITKTDNSTTYIPGTNVTYTIVVTNDGPLHAFGAQISDPLPAGITTGNWTCTAGAGAACGAASGSGALATTADLLAGSSITYTMTMAVPKSMTGPLSNVASVTPVGGEADPTDNQASDTDQAAPLVDLAITKASTPNPYVPGQALTYTIVVSNSGTSDAIGALVTDPLPGSLVGFGWTCVGSGGGTCPAAGSGSLTNVPVNVPVGGLVTFTVSGTVPSGTTGALTNIATVAAPPGGTDSAPGNNTAIDQNPTNARADLHITKVSSPNPYVPGQPLTYTVVVSNTGPSDAPGSLVQDTLPLPFASFTWTCTPSGGAVCGAGSTGAGNLNATVDLPVGSSITFKATGTVPSNLTGQVNNTATVTPPATVTEMNPGDNSAPDSNPANVQVDLEVVKTGPPSYIAGSSITYTIQVTNHGPSNASAARVQDTPPPSLTNVTWTCAPSGAGASCGATSGSNIIDALVDLPANTSVTYTMTATVVPGLTGTLTNTAIVTAPTGVTDTAPGNNSRSANSGGTTQANLGIVKTVTPEPYRPGTTVSYTITVSNAGPSNAIGARVQDTFPAPMSTFPWTCAGAGGATCGVSSGASVIDVLVNIPVGGTLTFSASGTVPVTTTATVTNTATVTPPVGTTDPNLNDNSSSATSTPMSADVSITKVDAVDPVEAGDSIVYTLSVANAGPMAATNVSVSDPLPAGTTYLSASGTGWNCAVAAGTVTCTRPSLAIGAPAPITLTLRAPNNVGIVNNTASVTAAEVDPDPTNNSSLQSTTVTAKADLTITKVSSPNPYVAGEPLSYTIVASNLGPSDVAGATVDDLVPPDVASFAWTCTTSSAGASCGTATGTGVVNTTVDLPSGASVTIVLTGTLPPGTTGQLMNTATITPPPAIRDPLPSNNSATDANPANNLADLRLSKASAPNPYVPGEPLTYTLVVTNAGPSNAIGARVTDPLPAAFSAFTWTCAVSGGANCPTPSGTGDIDVLVDLPVGSTATFTSTGTVPSSFSGQADNTAMIAPPADVNDPVPGNNQDSAQNAANVVADLKITKAQTPDPYTPGAPINYTLLVQNFGPSDVTHARVQDVLPGAVTGVTWSCAASGAGAICGSASGAGVIDAMVTLPAGTSATFTMTGAVVPSATGVLTNTATVSAPANVTDPVPGNNESTVNSGAAPEVDLRIVKSATPNPYVPGTPLTFTLVVSNAGPSDAPLARVQDEFPPALSGFAWTCAPSAGAATCGAASGASLIDTLVNLPVGGAVTFTISGTVPSEVGGTLTNTATVTPPLGIDERQPQDNLSTVTVTSAPMADLHVTKTSTPNPYLPGAPITYTVTYSNSGPSDVIGAHVQDQLPPVLTNINWTCVAIAGTCPAASGVGDVDALIDLASGGVATFTITADVPAGTRGPLVNSATIVPPPGIVDPTPTDNASVNANPVVAPAGPADLQITQEFPGVAPPNGLLTFRLVIRNLGSHPALNPYLTGMIPPGTTFVSATPSDGGTYLPPGNPPAPDPVTGYPIAGAAVAPLKATWPGLMLPDETHVLEFTVRVAPGTPTGQILWSCFWTWSETEDPYHANNVIDSYLFTYDGTSPVGDLSLQAAAMSLGVTGPDGRVTGADGTIGTEIAVPLGGTVKMRFWSINNGPAATRGQYALILDNTAIEVVDVALPQGWVSPSGPSSAVWDTGLVQPGQTVNVDLTLRLHTTGAIKLFAQRVTGAPGDPNASNERATIALDGYGPNAAGRWVAVGNVDGAPAGEIITGTGQGETPQVRVYTGAGSDTGVRFFAYERPFLGGVRIASCDVNGDGLDEIITAPGPGRASTIRVLSVVGGVVNELTAFDAFEPSFTGGAYVSCADLDADGKAEIVVGAGPGRAPEVQVYNAGIGSLTLRTTFLAYENTFQGGVRVAAGAYPGRVGWITGFGIATMPGPGRAAELRVWEVGGAPVAGAVISAATNGTVPVLGDANGDGRLDLIVTPDDGRPELVRILDIDDGTLVIDVSGNIPGFTNGIRAATGVLSNGTGRSELVIGNAAGGDPRVRVITWTPGGPVLRLEISALEIP